MMTAQTLSQSASNIAQLADAYRALLAETPATRIRNAAASLKVSELELLLTGVSAKITVLRNEPQQVLEEIISFGEVMALTRNDHVVHERHGVYDNMSFERHGPMHLGLAVNPDIDLRMFLQCWHHAIAVQEEGAHGIRHSLQFFDETGMAVHKIYLTKKSSLEAYTALVNKYSAGNDKQAEPLVLAQPKPAPAVRPDDEIDIAALEAAWRDLKDTHDFHLLMKKFSVSREQALRLVSDEYARKVDSNTLQKVLMAARDQKCEIMVFVGNRGCIQIHTGLVENLVPQGPWFNVLDPIFNLHINDTGYVNCYVTYKPTVDGMVTSLECFDAKGELTVQLFGKRKPGIPELQLWRDIIAAV
jgi:putative hemin transport protein